MLGTDRDKLLIGYMTNLYVAGEYRQALKNSDVISDFSFLIGDEEQSHFL